VVAAIDKKWDSLTAAQKEAFCGMYNSYRQVMSDWNIPNLRKENA
jgi:hypothetical protein